MRFSHFYLLCLILAIKCLFISALILGGSIGLGPDEAQYWTWSHHLDWGYYSKPPGIAWQIWLGTYFLGDSEFGVRAFSILIGTLLPLLVYQLGLACRLSRSACFWAAIGMALSPLGMLSSFLAITDGGMVLFWTAACMHLAFYLQRNQEPNYFILGAYILCGALFKWPIYFFWSIVGSAGILWRGWISWRIIYGIAFSLIGFLPSLYWNTTHHFATFKHVLSTLAGGHAPVKTGALVFGNPLEFLGAQTLLISPMLFVLLLLAFVKILKERSSISKGVLLCAGTSAIILGLAIFLSVSMKIQGNWAIFAYPTAFIVLGWYACEAVKKARAWLRFGLVFSVLLNVGIFALPAIQAGDLLNFIHIPYRLNPFKHNLGWKQLATALNQAGYDPKQDFLFGDKYQTASILSFYGEGQKRAYFFNLQGCRKNQFCFWPGMDQEQKGKRGFFILVENTPHLTQAMESTSLYQNKLKDYFEKVSFLGTKPIFTVRGEMVKGALIFECQNYNGKMPQNPELY